MRVFDDDWSRFGALKAPATKISRVVEEKESDLSSRRGQSSVASFVTWTDVSHASHVAGYVELCAVCLAAHSIGWQDDDDDDDDAGPSPCKCWEKSTLRRSPESDFDSNIGAALMASYFTRTGACQFCSSAK